MLVDEAKLAGAAKPVIFTDKDSPNGTITLWPEPLSDKDNIELDAWVRHYYLYTQRSSIDPEAEDEEKDRIERIAQQTAATLNWYSGLGIQIMASVEGMTQIMYMSVRKRSPKITPDKLRELLMNEQNLEEANKTFEELNLEASNSTLNPQIRGREGKIKKVKKVKKKTRLR